jgi:hypothetical protein
MFCFYYIKTEHDIKTEQQKVKHITEKDFKNRTEEGKTV